MRSPDSFQPLLVTALSLALSACPKHEPAEPVITPEERSSNRDISILGSTGILREWQTCPDPHLQNGSIVVISEFNTYLKTHRLYALEYPTSDDTEGSLMILNFNFIDESVSATDPNRDSNWKNWQIGITLPSCEELTPCFTQATEELWKEATRENEMNVRQKTNLCVQEAMNERNPGIKFD